MARCARASLSSYSLASQGTGRVHRAATACHQYVRQSSTGHCNPHPPTHPPARNAFGVFFGRRRSQVEGRSKTDPTSHRFQAQAHSVMDTVGSGYKIGAQPSLSDRDLSFAVHAPGWIARESLHWLIANEKIYGMSLDASGMLLGCLWGEAVRNAACNFPSHSAVARGMSDSPS